MANIETQTYRTLQQAGEYGNMSVAVLKAELVAAQINDTLDFGEIPPNSEILNVTLIADDQGTSVTFDIGYAPVTAGEFAAVADYWFDAEDVATAAVRAVSATVLPFTVPNGGGARITGLVEGGAATGSVWVIVEYVYVGA